MISSIVALASYNIEYPAVGLSQRPSRHIHRSMYNIYGVFGWWWDLDKNRQILTRDMYGKMVVPNHAIVISSKFMCSKASPSIIP